MPDDDVFCAACGEEAARGHDGCAGVAASDPPRFCTRCGRRLDVQIFPTHVRAACRTCDGIHPAHR